MTNDVLDAPQALELGLAHGGAPVHRGLDSRIEPDELPARFEPAEEITGVVGLSRGLEVARHAFGEPGDEVERLLIRPVEQPGVPRPDPADHLRRHAVF
ncbi:MAG TPA: hypothetical protein VLW44_15915 [Streptosporangiaceae bacterium]|nr:hypothetical protein [Streptosporangiaceae bacterium]